MITTLTKSIIGWKKAHTRPTGQPDCDAGGDQCYAGGDRYCIVKLRIPAGARVNNGARSPISNKHRADRAKVLAVEGVKRKRPLAGQRYAYAEFRRTFKYPVGKTVEPLGVFDPSDVVCAPGIHFFLTRAEAEAYAL